MSDIERIAAIRRRCHEATPGEWEARSRTTDDSDYPFTTYYIWAYPYGRTAGPVGICEGIMRSPNNEFLAHAREDVLWLLEKLIEKGRQ